MIVDWKHNYLEVYRCDNIKCEKCNPSEYTIEELMEMDYLNLDDDGYEYNPQIWEK